jgi:hypothetical protein
MSHLQTHEMRNRESALCIRLWSQPLVTRREGVSPDKLHFGVSEIATWKVEMPHLQIHETRIREKHFKHKRLVLALVVLGKELVQKSSVSEHRRSRNEVWRHSAQDCRNVEIRCQ